MATNKNFVVKNGLEVGGDITVTGSLTTAGMSLPSADGSSGQYLQTDGSGNLSWNTVVSSFNVTNGTTTDAVATGETITFTGGTNISISVADNNITFDNDIADSDDITEGSSNLFYTDARAISAIQGASNLTIDGGTLYIDTANNYVGIGDTSPQFMLDVGGTTGTGSIAVAGTEVIDSGAEIITARLKDSGVTAGTYGSASLVPVITVDAKGRITSASTTSVAGVSSFSFNGTTEILTINTADGGSFTADISALASETYVDTAVSNLVDAAPGTLDTLNELAAALGDDPNFATTITSALAGKVSKNGDTINGSLSVTSNLTVDTSTLSVDATNNRVGIGTASPSDLLDVSSAAPTIRLSDTDGYYAQIYGGSGSLVFRTDVGQATSGDTIQFIQSGTETMRIGTTGNVGIGKTNPEFPLDIVKDQNNTLTRVNVANPNSGSSALTIVGLGNNTNGSAAGLRLGSSTNTTVGANVFDIYQGLAAPMTFRTSGQERMRITSSGNVGIGTSSPVHELDVRGDITIDNESSSVPSMLHFNASAKANFDPTSRINFWEGDSHGNDYANANMFIEYNGSTAGGGDGYLAIGGYTTAGANTDIVTIARSGYVGINKAVPARVLDVDGNTRFNNAMELVNNFTSNTSSALHFNNQTSSGAYRVRFDANSATVGSIQIVTSGTTYNTTSDRRLKDNIVTITDGKEKLLAMNPVTHTWKANPNTGETVHGFIAQEMQQIVPEAVSGDPESDEMMSMDYGRITPVIVAALQDALKEIEELKTRIKTLEAK